MRRAFWISLALVLVLPGWSTVYADDDADLLLDVIPAISAGLKPNYAPVPKTGQTTSYGAGDDGTWQKGVAWPAPRFTDNGNGTVTDKLTGLIWLKNANAFGQRTRDQALSDANSLASGSADLTDGSKAGDWRLANVRELQSLLNYGTYGPALPAGHPFTGVQSSTYWSSTNFGDILTYGWVVSIGYGTMSSNLITNTRPVWCVRDGLNRGPKSNYAPVPKTGQTASYGAGDDGALQKGVAWPTPRFTNNGNGTVTDKLTGLVWLKNPNAFTQRTWTQALSDANSLASGSAGLTDGSKAGDWRLANVMELQSLIDHGRGSPALPAGHPFGDLWYGNYWSSTTFSDDSYGVDLNSGAISLPLKVSTNKLAAWCVRNGP
jgi:hypothetical protein